MVVESNPKLIETSMPFPSSRWGRFLYGLFVTIPPLFSFWVTHIAKPEWQSGKLSDYAILFLSPEASLFILPLLAYSVVCYLLLLINALRFAPLFLIRFGIYTGVLLALHYSIAILLALEPSPWLFILFFIWMSPLIFSRVYPLIVKEWNIRLFNKFVASFVVILALISMIVSRSVYFPFSVLLVFIVLVAPFWSFLLSVRAAIWLVENYEFEFTLSHGLGIGVWIAAYGGALRFNILKMHELYAALPPQPPCYIATAAAQGHPHIVRSKPVPLKNGNIMWVNSQLQHFKSVEIAMVAVSPKLHYFVRKIYDVVGKKLAAYIQNPLLADVAFLFLLPVEWISFCILKIFVPEIEVISKKIYHS